MIVGWVWRQPARPSAYGNHTGLRTLPESGGLAKAAVEDESLSTPNTPNLRPERHAIREQSNTLCLFRLC